MRRVLFILLNTQAGRLCKSTSVPVLLPAYQSAPSLFWPSPGVSDPPWVNEEAKNMCALQLYKQHFASEGGDDDEDEGDAVDGEGVADQLAPSAHKKRLVSGVPLLRQNEASALLCLIKHAGPFAGLFLC